MKLPANIKIFLITIALQLLIFPAISFYAYYREHRATMDMSNAYWRAEDPMEKFAIHNAMVESKKDREMLYLISVTAASMGTYLVLDGLNRRFGFVKDRG